MDLHEFQALLKDLRAFGADHQTVEAKRARGALPEALQGSLIAMANADGGVILLGVEEGGGAFEVTGVEDPGRLSAALQAICAELEPPLRPRISLVEHDQGTVVAAEFPPVPRAQRPCHRRVDGPHVSSFIRVGDADQRLDSSEVDEMLAERSTNDFSRRAHGTAPLDIEQVRAFVERVRRNDEDTPATLRRFGACAEDAVTVAGLLALGENPAAESPAARIAYRRTTRSGDPPGTRHQGRHLEGRVGELLDQAMVALRDDLPAVQVQRHGELVDEYEVPPEALREFVANALMHRSLTDSRETASVAIQITGRAVVITSPGGLHVAAEPSQLGLSPLSSVRNLALVRICEQLRTPAGARIVENQASGISTADAACRRANTMPALFIDAPTAFHVYLLRGALDTRGAAELLAAAKLDRHDADLARVVAAGLRLQAAREEEAGSPLARIVFDARFVARVLSPCSVPDAAAILRRLEDAAVLTRRRSRTDPTWVVARDLDRPPARATRRGSSRQRIDAVVLAIAGSIDSELGREAIGCAIDRRSSRTQVEWINAAIDAGYVEPTRENPYDPGRAYRLTPQGRAYAQRLAGDPLNPEPG